MRKTARFALVPGGIRKHFRGLSASVTRKLLSVKQGSEALLDKLSGRRIECLFRFIHVDLNAFDSAFLREEQRVAKYKKKRARQLRHDKFRDTTMSYVDRATHRLEGKGRKILYGIGAVAVLGLIVWGIMIWRGNRNEQAAQALGRAIKIAQTPVASAAVPGSAEPSFRTGKERAQKAVEEFQKVAASYSGTTGELARYFAATNQLYLDRGKAIQELEALTGSGEPEIAALSKFALAQALEANGNNQEAAKKYKEVADLNSTVITPDTARLRLALVYKKSPDKKQEAVDILFNMVEASRKAKDKDGKPVIESASVRQAADELEKLDPTRFAQLPPPPLPGNFTVQ